MPPCLGSPATAVVSEPAAISSEAATTHRCARRIAIPPCSLALLRRCVLRWTVSCIHNCGRTLRVSLSRKPSNEWPAHPYGKLLRKCHRWQGTLARLVDAPWGGSGRTQSFRQLAHPLLRRNHCLGAA